MIRLGILALFFLTIYSCKEKQKLKEEHYHHIDYQLELLKTLANDMDSLHKIYFPDTIDRSIRSCNAFLDDSYFDNIQQRFGESDLSLYNSLSIMVNPPVLCGKALIGKTYPNVNSPKLISWSDYKVNDNFTFEVIITHGFHSYNKYLEDKYIGLVKLRGKNLSKDTFLYTNKYDIWVELLIAK